MNMWILVADASRARIFAVNEPDTAWVLEKELEHPKSRAKATDLTTDIPGRMQQSFGAGARSAMPERTDPKEVEAEFFARELAELLEQGSNRNKFERLVLVAPPHFLGLLRMTLNVNVAKRIHQSLDKDFTQLPAHELPKHVPLNLK